MTDVILYLSRVFFSRASTIFENEIYIESNKIGLARLLAKKIFSIFLEKQAFNIALKNYKNVKVQIHYTYISTLKMMSKYSYRLLLKTFATTNTIGIRKRQNDEKHLQLTCDYKKSTKILNYIL